ncbi:molybdopterin molybdotransferase MoeA [Xylanimonas protaetiae]|uniref:molybdopterin molybdotransferase MoeA n=1 Tax=Xylanimonas protaetiae TaxID=2509457 RepID=UPI0013EB6A50|nr:molybdopterin molybdotransferase MoeA [Xylanimonas protaetiae]
MSSTPSVRTIDEHVATLLARIAAVRGAAVRGAAVRGAAGRGTGNHVHSSGAFVDGGPSAPAWLPLDDAALAEPGIALADDVVAVAPVPGFDHAAVDGYAVRLAGLPDDQAVTLTVAGAVRAGDPGPAVLGPGEAVRIMTGAPLPPGADAVVPVEATSTGRFAPGRDGTEATVTLTRPHKANVRRRGEDVAVGVVLARRGDAVTPALIAAAAASRVGGLRVARRPAAGGPGAARPGAGSSPASCRPGTTESGAAHPLASDTHAPDGPPAVPTRGTGTPRPYIAVVSTGSELRPWGGSVGPGGVVDSNSLMVGAIVRAAGGEPVRRGGVPDDAAALRAVLDKLAGDVDLIVTTGGVSAGAWDVVREVLTAPGGPAADVDLTGVAMRPGRPQGLATWRGVPWVALPGTPVAAFAATYLFVRPALAALRGETGPCSALLAVAPDAVGWGTAHGRGCGSPGMFTRVVPVRTTVDGVVPASGAATGGHALSALLGADGLALVPADGAGPGDLLEVVPL